MPAPAAESEAMVYMKIGKMKTEKKPKIKVGKRKREKGLAQDVTPSPLEATLITVGNTLKHWSVLHQARRC